MLGLLLKTVNLKMNMLLLLMMISSHKLKKMNKDVVRALMNSLKTLERRVARKLGKKTKLASNLLLVVRNALISFVIPKKFTKKYVQKLKLNGIDSFVRVVTKTILRTLSVNFVNKFMKMNRIKKMIQNGLGVINVIDGYLFFYLESSLMLKKVST